MPENQALLHRARWLMLADGDLLENAVISVVGGRIESIDKYCRDRHAAARDWGESLFSPALVNAHTHLEFSHLERPLGCAGMEFSQWIRAVLQWRRQPGPASQIESACELPALQGLRESRQAGVRALADVVSNPWILDHAQIAAVSHELGEIVAANGAIDQVDVLPFLEQLGAKPGQAAERWQAVTQVRLNAAQRLAPELGLSPHAPYSTSHELFARMMVTAEQYRLPVAMHLAESRSERELLESGRGPFRELLDDLQLWTDRSALPSIDESIIGMACGGPRGLIIHGNYLNTAEMDLIARYRNKLTVVYCPRTHQYFDHEPYPLEQLGQRGINVAVGTDSRASNPDLDLFAELQSIFAKHSELSPREIWKMGTVAGARALGCDQEWGSILPGQRADWLCWPLDAVASNDPLEYLLAQKNPPQRFWSGCAND